MNSKLRTSLLSAALSTAVVTAAALPVTVYAASNTDQVVEASTADQANPKLKLSQDGFNVMRDVRAVRLSIFNGDTDGAKRYIDLAKTDLKKTKQDKAMLEKHGDSADNGDWVPIDGRIVVSDDFVATKENKQHIGESNKKLEEGKPAEAMRHLQLAEVDAGFTRVLMPIDQTEAYLKKASELIDDGAYYEANIALKSVEDGLVFDTVALVGTPKAPTSSNDNSSSSNNPSK